MSIERWLGARLGDVVETSDQEDLRVDCPFCRARHGRDDTGKHLYVSVVKPVAHCFRCSWTGHWIGLIIGVEGCRYHEALEYLEHPVIDIRRFDKLYSPRGIVNVEPVVREPVGFRPFGIVRRDDWEEKKAVRKYAYARIRKMDPFLKLDAKEIINRRFGWIQGTNRLWMLIDEEWWQGRAIDGSMLKYISPSWPIGDSLWNAGALDRFGHVVICEGVFSALFVGGHAIAICSKNLTEAQVIRIVKAKRVKEITIMFDADADIERFDAAGRLERAGFQGVIRIHCLFNGDPADGLEGDIINYDLRSRVESVL